MLNENIAKIYANLIKKGIRTLENTPLEVRPLVEEILEENGAK